ncbi:MAG TPA: MauE/DoxX family redox-associated membrane protein [Pyrinomonadaceae bacterium]|nr:MauE/DoxX family redox-associated membrane protein [Pyrinomonadaceae bacterium]
MDVIVLIIRLVLFAVFAFAAIGKFLDLKGSEKAVKDFGTPDEFAKTFAIALPFAEIIFAFCFLFVSTSWVGAIGGLILLLTFTGGMLWQMSQGNAPDCHCFGQIHSEPVGRKSLVRNIIFSVLALVLVVRGRDEQGYDLTSDGSGSMQLILIFFLLVLVVAALFYLKKVLDGQAEILKRINVIEALSGDGSPLERSNAGSPHDGLPIGAPFPDFDLSDISNRRANLSTALKGGRPAVFMFVSPTCEPCKALLPELERWEAELGDRVNFVLFSGGTADANADKFAAFSDEVILQKNRELAEQVHARWTPTAIFVRADGSVGSHPAAGDNAIRELVDNIRKNDVSDSNVFFAGTGSPAGSPKIGQRVPEFSLKAIDGNLITSDNMQGRRTMTVFWSPTCPHCTAMMNDLREWDNSRKQSDPDLIVFSDGEKESHTNLGLKAPIILDSDYKTAEKLGMYGTPSAVIVDESGTIVTETAMGAGNIWALIGRRPHDHN